MNNDILKPKDESLASLATELGLVVMMDDEKLKPQEKEIKDTRPAKPFSQLT